MNKFNNPHQNFNNSLQQYPNTQMQQNIPMQQQMYPNMPMQQQMYPNMPMQQQMYPNMPMQQQMYPNMPMQQQMYPNMPMQQQMYLNMPMQQQMYPNIPMQQFINRGMPMQSLQQSIPAQQFVQQDLSMQQNMPMQQDKRFVVQNNQLSQIDQSKYQQENKNINFELTNSLLKGVKMDKKEILNLEEDIASDCLEENIEAVLELFFKQKNENNNLKGCFNKVFVHKNFYNTNNFKDKLNNLFKLEDTEFATNLYQLYSQQKERENIVVIKEIDDYFTTLINDFCYLETNSKPIIDSFMIDYYDLLKVLSNENMDVKLKEVISFTLNKIINLNSIIEEEPHFCFNTEHNLIFLNFISTELNLDKLDNTFSYLLKTKNNELFYSISELVFKNKLDKYAILITLDRKIYKIYKTEKNDLYIKTF